MRIRFGSDESHESRESNCPETTSTPEEPEIREEIVVRMLDELIDKAKEAASLVTQGEASGGPHHEQGIRAESEFMLIHRDTSLSAHQRVNLIQQGRQERGVEQRQSMDTFLTQLDQEIDDAT